VSSWDDHVETTHQSHELRLSTPDDWRLRGLIGAFWEDFDIKDDMNFLYKSIPSCTPANLLLYGAGTQVCVGNVIPAPGYAAIDPTQRNDDVAFGEDLERGYKQTAFFTSIDYDLIPKVLTLTGGTRYYDYKETMHGSQYSTSTGCAGIPNGACVGSKLTDATHDASYSGFKSRGNLTWHITPDIMAYYTYSQGFRPGGFNRTESAANGTIKLKAEAPYIAGDNATKQYYKPAGYGSDNLINQEVGLKSEFFEHRLQANLSLYRMAWDNVQLSLFDPVHLGNTTFDVNGPTYVVKGIELQLVARVTEGLTVQGSSSWNSTNQTVAPCLMSNIPASKGNPTPVGECITQINSVPYTNPYGVLDTSPAFSPPLLFNLRARYDFAVGDYKPFLMAGANHVASQRNQPASFPTISSPLCSPIPTTTHCQYTMPGYTTYDASVGVAKDQWTAQVTGSNITNVDASTLTSSAQFIESQVPIRPRVVMLQFGYKF
jgi:outer membrane receptor protein involved in Fe transport